MQTIPVGGVRLDVEPAKYPRELRGYAKAEYGTDSDFWLRQMMADRTGAEDGGRRAGRRGRHRKHPTKPGAAPA